MRERAMFLPVDDQSLYAVEYAPSQPAHAVWILLNPLDNEAHYSTRLYVRLARSLTSNGAAALRFDYRGTGNSLGEFQDVSLAALEADVATASRHLLTVFGDLPICLLGGRFGANLAWSLAPRLRGLHGLVLWDPILRPGREFRTSFVNKTLLNNKLMGGPMVSVRSLEAALERQGHVELNGASFSSHFYNEMTNGSFPIDRDGRSQPARILMTTQPSAPESTILGSLEELGAKVEFFEEAGPRNAWSGEQFSASGEAKFLARATLDFAGAAAYSNGAG